MVGAEAVLTWVVFPESFAWGRIREEMQKDMELDGAYTAVPWVAPGTEGKHRVLSALPGPHLSRCLLFTV